MDVEMRLISGGEAWRVYAFKAALLRGTCCARRLVDTTPILRKHQQGRVNLEGSRCIVLS